MYVAKKWFLTFNGFCVALMAADDGPEIWTRAQVLGLVPKIAATELDSCGYCASSEDHANVATWVAPHPQREGVSAWAPEEVAVHELTHVLSHLEAWISDKSYGLSEPAAYMMAACYSMYVALIQYQRGEADLSALQQKAKALDFELIEV